MVCSKKEMDIVAIEKRFRELDLEYNPNCEEFMQAQLVDTTSFDDSEINDIVEGDDPSSDMTCEDYRDSLFLARLSAPGYMDCTDWTIINSVEDLETWFSMWLD